MRHVLMISFLFGLSIVTFSQTRKGTMCATDGNFPDVLKSIWVEKTREAAKYYRHQSLIASTVVAGSAFTLGSSRLSQS